MPDTFKVLGQQAGSTSGICLYNAPTGASASATISTVTISNNTNVTQTFKLWVISSSGPSAGVAATPPAVTSAQYLYYDQIVDPNSCFAITIGITLGSDASICVQNSSTSMSNNAFGIEVT
jgi:hypothetical protein